MLTLCVFLSYNRYIPDPDAKKPEDWDDEMDGEFEPPQVSFKTF